MLTLETDGSQVRRRFDGDGLGVVLPEIVVGEGEGQKSLSPAEGLADWAQRYRDAVVSGARPTIQDIGSEMYRWLDQGGALSDWVVGGERVLEIRQNPATADGLSNALLAAPWEVLFHKDQFLASETSLFTVARRCTAVEQPPTPKYADLMMMFMAAAPEGQSNLDHEREEAAILEATRATAERKPLAHVQVEESGALEFLSQRLRLDGPFEILHLSCHGTIQAKEDGAQEPILLLETDVGDADLVGPDKLVTGLGNQLPPMVFLSACRTAEQGAAHPLPGMSAAGLKERDMGKATGEKAVGSNAPDLAEPYVRQLARYVPNVVGWDGSVLDDDATIFAESFYGALSKGETAPRAAAMARRDLFRAQSENPDIGNHWHLARVYLGPGGGGSLSNPTAANSRPANTDAATAFLDAKNKKVPVAKRTEFVGRRRQIQQIIRTFRSGPDGVLVHGMGNLGKSSLAARVSDRMTGHRLAVVVGECTATAIFDSLKGAVQSLADDLGDLDKAKQIRDDLERAERDLAENSGALEETIRWLLKNTLADHPILLVLDDFEQSLGPPTPDPKQRSVTVKTAFRPALQALFRAFEQATTRSRLLITSRFDFELLDVSGADLAKPLFRVPLATMQPLELARQWRAKARAEEREETAAGFLDLLNKASAVSGGNPGLLDVLIQPIFRGEKQAANNAIETIESFLATGTEPPADKDVGDFFQRMAFDTYAAALAPSERIALGAACFFQNRLPIPLNALEAAAEICGLAEPKDALDRLLALGMLDDWGEMKAWPDMPPHRHVSANPLARHLGETIADNKTPAIATASLPILAQAWRHERFDFPLDGSAVETTRIALMSDTAEPELLEAATRDAVIFLERESQNPAAAVKLAQPALAALERTGYQPGASLLLYTISAAEIVGVVELQDELIDTALARDDFDKRSRALLFGQKADRLFQRGELEEARRIREQEALPVYRALGDRREIAVTMSKIADILFRQGELEEARRIREQEELPVYRALGDRREIAVTMGKIADILFRQGELEEARRIREQEELPVYRALGDRRSIAVTMGQIADILFQQGELEEARRIREQEELPVYRALGDRREIAVTMGKIADILFQQGELEEALAIHLARMDTAKDLGDTGMIAHIRFSCAQIRLAKENLEPGEFGTAAEELSEAYQINLRLQQPDGIGAVGTLLGQVLAAGGLKEEAYEVLTTAATAFDKLSWGDQADQCRALIEHIKGDGQ